MQGSSQAISALQATMPRSALAQMIRLVRTLYRLSQNPAYQQAVLKEVPETGRFNPGHASVMMGYDFHLTDEGPRLIEVNTNAGGGLFAFLAHMPDTPMGELELPAHLEAHLRASFMDEMQAFSGGRFSLPATVAILDEAPQDQFLYPEMQAFARLFERWGVTACIVDPSELDGGSNGIFHQGKCIDLIYNRHCDFFLESDAMAAVRAAYLSKSVCLTPNPFTYGLLADKRRLSLWTDAEKLAQWGLSPRAIELLTTVVPESHLLSDLDPDEVWSQRKGWVFKPVTRFGSRGVLLGRKISRSRFNEQIPADTLVQRYAPPSITSGSEESGEMKTDFRLYVYGNRILGVAARLYQGQVTNLRTPGGGFAPVRLVEG